jgi:putative lipase involved disintegration of autophagic bodies
MMTEQSLRLTVTLILAMEALLLVLCIPTLLYVGKQVEAFQSKKTVWIQHIRELRHQVATTKRNVGSINITTKTILPATLASGPWKIILPILLRLI